MKKFLVAGVAAAAFCGAPVFAADMPVKAALPIPMVNWTGCYVGGNVGGGSAHKENFALDINQSLGTHTASGAIAGGQIGCDYQFSSNWVIGVQGLFDWADLKGKNIIPQNPLVAYSTKISSMAATTARVGYLFTPSLLAFVEGGATWLRDFHQQLDPPTVPVPGTQETLTRMGGTVGGGFEYLFARNWSAFAKYDYTSFKDKTTDFVGCGFPCNKQKLNLQTALVGINYRFDWGKSPVVAKY